MLSLKDVEPPKHRGGAARAAGFLRPYLFGAVSSLYLFLIGWVHRRNRALIVMLSEHFGYRYSARERPTLPMVEINDVIGEQTPIDVRAIDATEGNVSERELIVLCKLVQEVSPATVFEFGTFDGRTTLNLAANTPKSSKIYTLDLPPGLAAESVRPLDPQELTYAVKAQVGNRYSGTEVASRIVQLFGDSGNFDFSRFLQSTDFIFIDGSHAYEYVINDSLQALEMLRTGKGTILWHDYSTWDGVTRALHDLRQHHPAFSQIRWIGGTTLALLRR